MTGTTGRCLCGAVTYEGKGERGEIHVCHCESCRRWSGGPAICVSFSGGFDIADPEAVLWFQSSEWAERGSCRSCGSTLFYRLTGDTPYMNVSAGSLDQQDGLGTIHEHIYADAKPSYYEFADGAPRTTGAEFVARFQSPEETHE
jgi:hypothetical protein